MKIRKFLIAFAGLSIILTCSVVGQEFGGPIVTPSAATVVPKGLKRVTPGQKFTFQIQFNPAPDNYDKGYIHYRFERSDSAPYPAPLEGNATFRDGLIQIGRP